MYFYLFDYNKTLFLRITLSLNSMSCSSKLSNLRVVMGTPEFIASCSGREGGLGTPNLGLVSEVRAGL